MKLNIELNDLEVKTTKTLNNEKEYFEIVRWITSDKPHYYTLAIFDQTKEGYNIRFIGNRPFDDAISNDFWTIAKMAQAILDLFWCDKDDDRTT